MNIEQASVIGSLAKFGILLIVFSMILSQLNIGNDLISKLTQYLFAALGLGLAIAIGLGGKDAAKELIDRIFEQKNRIKKYHFLILFLKESIFFCSIFVACEENKTKSNFLKLKSSMPGPKVKVLPKHQMGKLFF